MAKNINYKPKIIIIGSGISGYAGAVICLKQGYEVNIIEKNDYIGGKMGNSINILCYIIILKKC